MKITFYLFQHYTNYMQMPCGAIVRLIVLVVEFANKSMNYQEGAAIEHPENRLRYSSDHPQTMTACRYGNINDERAAKGLLEAEVCDEVGELSCTRSCGLSRKFSHWSGPYLYIPIAYVCMPSCRRYAVTRSTAVPFARIWRAFNIRPGR